MENLKRLLKLRALTLAMLVLGVMLMVSGMWVYTGRYGTVNVCSSYDTCEGSSPTVWGVLGLALAGFGAFVSMGSSEQYFRDGGSR